jgi:hypothetical protein
MSRTTNLTLVAVTTALLLAPLTALRAAEPIAAFTPNGRILFQGDSITDGNRGRSADPNHILGHGYVFIIAARNLDLGQRTSDLSWSPAHG